VLGHLYMSYMVGHVYMFGQVYMLEYGGITLCFLHVRHAMMGTHLRRACIIRECTLDFEGRVSLTRPAY